MRVRIPPLGFRVYFSFLKTGQRVSLLALGCSKQFLSRGRHPPSHLKRCQRVRAVPPSLAKKSQHHRPSDAPTSSKAAKPPPSNFRFFFLVLFFFGLRRDYVWSLALPLASSTDLSASRVGEDRSTYMMRLVLLAAPYMTEDCKLLLGESCAPCPCLA